MDLRCPDVSMPGPYHRWPGRSVCNPVNRLRAGAVNLVAGEHDMRLLIAAAAIALSAIPAHATPHNVGQYRMTNNGKLRPVTVSERPRMHRHLTRHASKRVHGHHYARQREQTHERSSVGVIYLPHPAGCPRTAFCACGAAVEIFGQPIRNLWLAANWFKFPRAAPGPERVGVKRHHVIVLLRQIEGSLWLVADFNSGGHRSRLHVRSIAGYVIVDPHQKLASR